MMVCMDGIRKRLNTHAIFFQGFSLHLVYITGAHLDAPHFSLPSLSTDQALLQIWFSMLDKQPSTAIMSSRVSILTWSLHIVAFSAITYAPKRKPNASISHSILGNRIDLHLT